MLQGVMLVVTASIAVVSEQSFGVEPTVEYGGWFVVLFGGAC